MPNIKSAIRKVKRIKKQSEVNKFRKNRYKQAIKKIQKNLGKLFFVIYSDNLLNFDLSKMVNYHIKKKSDITMALYSIKKNPFTGIASSSIVLDKKFKIVNFNEKRGSKGSSKYLVNTGVIIFNQKIFNFHSANCTLYKIKSNIISDELYKTIITVILLVILINHSNSIF